MKLSVVILNYNVRYFLQQCLLSVKAATANIDSEIIVVDNNSEDDSITMVRAIFPEVILIANTENCGFPKGNNIGVAAAKGEYVCILNPDTVVAEDTFKKAIDFADTATDFGIMGVRLIDGAGNFLPESKRGIPTPRVALAKILNLHRIFPQIAVFNKYYGGHLNEFQSGKVEILVGAFMLMKRETYLSVGGFDENCFMYSDDIDLSYMVMKSGKSNYYFGGTSVIHYKGESTVRDAAYMQRFREAMDFFYKKHFRTSVFFDAFMKAGAHIFALIKKNKVIPPAVPRKFILVSDNDELRNGLSELLNVDVTLEQFPQKRNHTRYFFDSEKMSFTKIISQIEKLHGNGNTFRVVHDRYGFAIGSDSSIERGETLLW
ncbi:MAG: glycosyltransferase family 2 protein [Flavobacterium sp.]|nr:MAG: glycosyltransferase family 2 protein [Flavobacterium sp.]